MSEPMDLSLSQIGQIAVTVDDLEQATRFYRDRLGMELLFEVPGMAFFRCGEVRLMLGTPEGTDEDGPSHILYYRVEDISAAHRILSERGVEFVREPRRVHRDEEQELWLTFFRDPAGHTLALMSEVPARSHGEDA